MRSPLLMSAETSALLVVDIQEKLARVMPDRERVVDAVRRLVRAADLVGVPLLVTEQYRKGLGPTVPELADRLPDPIEKLAFSGCGEPALLSELRKLEVGQVLVTGMECHVCVMQTALDLQAAGLATYVAADAVCSRREMDYHVGLKRMHQAGVTLTTSEAAIFEWLRVAGTDTFKQVLKLIK